jgi:hypothetical protein
MNVTENNSKPGQVDDDNFEVAVPQYFESGRDRTDGLRICRPRLNSVCTRFNVRPAAATCNGTTVSLYYFNRDEECIEVTELIVGGIEGSPEPPFSSLGGHT